MTDGIYKPDDWNKSKEPVAHFTQRDTSVLNLEGILLFSVVERNNVFAVEVKTPWRSTHVFSPTYVSSDVAIKVLEEYRKKLTSREYELKLTSPTTASIQKSIKYS